METTAKRQNGSIISPSLMEAKWKLTYTPLNSLKGEAFGVKVLDPFEHPINHKMVYPLNGADRRMPYYAINSLQTILIPDKQENNEHYNAVLFLLAHPEVMVEGLEINGAFRSAKNPNSQVKLVNLDYEDRLKLDDQEVIDSVISKLSIVGGKDAVNDERLKCILSMLELPFYDKRYINDPKQHTLQLRKKVKDYARKNVDNAKEVDGILNNMDDAKKMYLIAYLIGTEDLVYSAGSYKFKNYPIAHNKQGVLDVLKMNPNTFGEFQEVMARREKGLNV